MVLQQKEAFTFLSRSRRLLLDRVNAMLSFTHTL
ncbi:CRISPR-associated endonuclease Cas1 [Bacillus sp. NPDC077027]